MAVTLLIAGVPLIWTGGQTELGYIFIELAVVVFIGSILLFSFDLIWGKKMTDKPDSPPPPASGIGIVRNDGTVNYHGPVHIGHSAEKSSPRNPDGIYQHGQQVATVSGAAVNQAHGLITFQTIHSITGTANPDMECEYRDWVIVCRDLPRNAPNVVATFSVGMTVGGQATILRKRD